VKLSQTLLGSDCLRAMQFKIEDDLYRGGIIRATGTGFHAGLALMYVYRQAEMEPPTFIEMENAAYVALDQEIVWAEDRFIWDKKIPTVEDAQNTISTMLGAYMLDKTPAVWPADWKVLGVEVPFEMLMVPGQGPITRTSRGIDLVLQAPDGGIVAVDHKTGAKGWGTGGKAHPRKNVQAPWYIPAMRQLWPDAPYYRFVFDVMRYDGVFQRFISDPQDKHIAAVESKALSVKGLWDWHLQSGLDLPANPSSNLCNPLYCDYFDQCPHGRVLEQ